MDGGGNYMRAVSFPLAYLPVITSGLLVSDFRCVYPCVLFPLVLLVLYYIRHSSLIRADICITQIDTLLLFTECLRVIY